MTKEEKRYLFCALYSFLGAVLCSFIFSWMAYTFDMEEDWFLIPVNLWLAIIGFGCGILCLAAFVEFVDAEEAPTPKAHSQSPQSGPDAPAS